MRQGWQDSSGMTAVNCLNAVSSLWFSHRHAQRVAHTRRDIPAAWPAARAEGRHECQQHQRTLAGDQRPWAHAPRPCQTSSMIASAQQTAQREADDEPQSRTAGGSRRAPVEHHPSPKPRVLSYASRGCARRTDCNHRVPVQEQQSEGNHRREDGAGRRSDVAELVEKAW